MSEDTGPKFHLVCKLVGASEFINGMAFERQDDGSVKTIEPVGLVIIENYKNFDGWLIIDLQADKPVKPVKPVKPAKEPAAAAPAPELEPVVEAFDADAPPPEPEAAPEPDPDAEATAEAEDAEAATAAGGEEMF